MKPIINRTAAFICAALCSISLLSPVLPGRVPEALVVSAASEKAADTAASLISELADSLLEDSPSLAPSYVGGDWSVIILAKAGILDDELSDAYYSNVVEYVSSKKGQLSTNRSTEYSRQILALASIGRDPSDVGGYDLLKGLSDLDLVTKQGMNGSAWAIIALDSGNFAIPDTGAKNPVTREKLVAEILSAAQEDGSFAGLEGCEAEYTAMALLALSRHTDIKGVSDAIDKGVAYLSKAQNSRGGFSTRWGESSETTSQVILALSAVGISADDSRFVKNGISVLDNLLSYRTGNGFAHTKVGGKLKYDRMATEQGLLALGAAARVGEHPFDFLSVGKNNRPVGEKTGLPGKNADISVPSIKYTKSFPDVSGESLRECSTAVDALSSRGIIGGYEDGTFRPDNRLTRAEFAALIVRALGLKAKKTPSFTDVPANEWYAGPVAAASEYGIILGIGNNRFDPNGTITREEAAVMCARAAKLCGMETSRSSADILDALSVFSDYRSSEKWAREALAFCVGEGLLDGEAVNLRPLDKITRSETAIMLFTLLGRAKLI